MTASPHVREALRRKVLCDAIVARARAYGLDASRAQVMRKWQVWERWYTGNLATGYLIKQTAVQPIKRTEKPASDNPVDV